MCDLSALRKMAESSETVTIDAATLIKLLDAAESIPVQLVHVKAKREPRQGTGDDERCARWMFDVLRQVNPAAKEPNYAVWANDVRLLREQDNRTHHDICGLFRWAQQNDFWCANVLSPKKLRKNWDQLVMQRRREPGQRAPAQLGKQGQATAQNAQRWLEEHGNAA